MNMFEKRAMIAREFGIDADEISRRKRFLEFGDYDAALLLSLQENQQHYEEEIANAFFEHLLAFPEIRDFVPDEATLLRLKKTLSSYFRGLLSGEYGDEYIQQRLHVGSVHKRVGLDPKWYLGAYRKYLSHFLYQLWQLYSEDHEKFLATYDALLKIVLFDVGLAIDIYHHADKQEVLQFEQRLQGLLDGIDAIVWEADPAMQFTFVSHQAQAMLGYPLARWTQEPAFWQDIMLPDDREAAIAFCRNEIAAGRGYALEYRVRTADGRVLWIHGRASMMRDKEGAVVGLRGLMVDISALKEAEKKLVHLASYDELTGLPRPALLQDRPLPADEYARLWREFDGLPRAQLAQEAAVRTLLLVDDEVNITTSLKRLLRSEGYQILTATSGKAGLELLAANPVGVIISDQRMPEMTGVEFLRRVKELYPDTVRVVLSGYTELKSVTDAINEGAIYKFLTKPWDDEQLREHVREAFQRYELKHENARLGREIERANHELSEINRALERRVAEKTEQIRHSIGVLQVSQEILEHLPAAVVGIDDEGLIVIANRRADDLLAVSSGSLLGCEAEECLPPPLVAGLADAAEGPSIVTLADGCRLSVIRHRMGEACKAKGTILVFSLLDDG